MVIAYQKQVINMTGQMKPVHELAKAILIAVYQSYPERFNER